MKEPKDFKGTPGKWQTFDISDICMGVESADRDGIVGYGQVLCNPILPDTDEQYEIEREEIIANMQLMSYSKEMLICLQDLLEVLDPLLPRHGQVEKLIKKALTVK